MKDIFLLTEVYEHHNPGQASHPYIVRSGFASAARRLLKKGLVTRHPMKSEGIIALGTLTNKGAFVLELMKGMIDAC